MKQTSNPNVRKPDDSSEEIKRLEAILADKDRQIAELQSLIGSSLNQDASFSINGVAPDSFLSSPLINILPDGLVFSDFEGKILAVSPQVVELYGAEEVEFFVGRSIFEFLVSDDYQRAQLNYREFLAGNMIGPSAYTSLNLRGENISFEVNGTLIGNDSGTGGLIIYLVRDLALRNELETTLNENQKLLNAIIENNTTVIYLRDPEGRLVNANSAWSKLTGIERFDAIGKTDAELYGVEFALLYEELDRKVREMGQPFTVEDWFERDGKRSYFSTTKFPVYGSDGNLKGICGMSSDITDLKLAQQRSDQQLKLQQLLIETSNAYIDLPEELLDQTINDSLKKLGEYIGADRFYLFSYDFVHMTASNTHEWCAEGIEPQIEFLQKTPVDDLHDWLAAHRQGKPFTIYDVLSLDDNNPARLILEPQGIKSIITVPIMDGTECIGFAGFDSVRKHHLFNESDSVLLELFTRAVVNVLNRYRQERQLRETTRKLSTLINNLKGFAFRYKFDVENAMEFVSDGILEISGYTPNEIIEKKTTFYTLVLPADQAMLRATISEAVDSREPYIVEYRILHANGSIRWLWEKGQPVFGVDGVPFLEGFVTDISDRKTAEKALQISELKYKFIAENTSDGLLVLDHFSQLVYASPAYLKQLGYNEDNLFLFEENYLKNLVHPEDYDSVLRSIQKAVGSTQPGSTFTYRALHHKGYFIWLEDNAAYLYDEFGKLQTSTIISRDITARRVAEEEIRKLSTAVQQSPVSIVITNRDGNIEYLNPKTEQTTGFSSAELTGKNLRILQSGVTQLEVYNHLWKTITNGKEWKGIIQNRKKNGELYWESSTIAPIINSLGEITHFIAVKEDITEKINQDLEIKKLSMAVEQSPVSIEITDTEGTIIYVNQAVLDSSGYTIDELLGENPRIFKTGLTNPKLYEELWETIKAGKKWQGEWLNKKKNGDLLWEKVSISPIFSDDGQIEYFLAIKQDITDNKKIESEIRDLNQNLEEKILIRTHELEISNLSLLNEIEERKRIETALQIKTDQLEKFFTVSLDLLCITTLDGEFIELNKAWEDILGFSSEQIRKRRFFDLIHPDDVTATSEAVEILRTEGNVVGFTNRYLTSQGDYRNIEWHSVMVGNLIYGAARDVTDWILLEKSLRESIEREKELNELKSRFVSTASHEFQTPLSSILISGASLLNYWDKYSSEQIALKLENIIAKARHLGEIVTNVMQVSRIQAGQTNFNPATFDLVMLCRQAIKDVETGYRIRGLIELRTRHTSIPVWGDRILILQVLINLLSNAVKYSQPKPEVFVSLDIENGSLVVCVGDNGIGIPNHDLENLFTPFFRGANVRNIEGNGLGLVIVKDNIDLHKGSVWVENQQKIGTKFYVSLPIIEKET